MVNTATENSHVASMGPGNDGELGLRTIGMGWRVRNRYTLKWVNGTRHKPQIPSTAEERARTPGPSTTPPSSRYPILRKKRNRVQVSPASPGHQVAQIGVPPL